MASTLEFVRASRRFFVVASAAALVALLSAGRAEAHDMKLSVDIDGDPIKVEARFDDGTPAQMARAKVVRETGEEVAAGTTDENGRWSFPKPGPGRYRVDIELAGHRTSLHFTIPGAESEPDAPAVVEGDMRLSQKLGLSIGLTLLLGGSAAFIAIRRMKRAAS